MLQSLGHHVTIATYRNGRDLPELTIERTLPIPWRRDYEVGSSRHKIAFDALLGLKTMALLIRRRFDVIHAHLHEGVDRRRPGEAGGAAGGLRLPGQPDRGDDRPQFPGADGRVYRSLRRLSAGSITVPPRFSRRRPTQPNSCAMNLRVRRPKFDRCPTA
ncbi:MAG: hypothetical protein R2838_12680 [Caldilineaceae bacterium]